MDRILIARPRLHCMQCIKNIRFGLVFSERELTYTFAICCCPSVYRLSVIWDFYDTVMHLCSIRNSVMMTTMSSGGWLSSVTFMRPTQPVEIFRNVSMPYLVPWPSINIQVKFYGDVPGEPLRFGVKRKRGSQIWRFWTCRRLYLGNSAR